MRATTGKLKLLQRMIFRAGLLRIIYFLSLLDVFNKVDRAVMYFEKCGKEWFRLFDKVYLKEYTFLDERIRIKKLK